MRQRVEDARKRAYGMASRRTTRVGFSRLAHLIMPISGKPETGDGHGDRSHPSRLAQEGEHLRMRSECGARSSRCGGSLIATRKQKGSQPLRSAKRVSKGEGGQASLSRRTE